jgi:hypothetical protein
MKMEKKMIQSFLKMFFAYMFTIAMILPSGLWAKSQKNQTAVQNEQYVYQVAIVTIFQNEAPYLKEWIEYHKLIGVEHFYLFNNLSQDDYRAVLEPYIDSGEVELIQWPYKPKNEKNWIHIQRKAYEKAISKAIGKAKWLALIDSDEFILPMQSDDLGAFLEDYLEFGGVAVNWQMFGTSHISKIPKDKLLIESLTLKSADDFIENRYVKSIVRPEAVDYLKDVHAAIFKPGYALVHPNKEICEGPFPTTIDIDKIRINHYWSRDEDYFYNVKLPRRLFWAPKTNHEYLAFTVFNEFPDSAILRFVERLRKAMALN